MRRVFELAGLRGACAALALLVAPLGAVLGACGTTTGVSVRLKNADKLGADRAVLEATIDGAPLECGAGAEQRDCQNVVPALEARPLLADEDVRIVVDDALADKVITVKVTVTKEGAEVGERLGMAQLVLGRTKVIEVDFAAP